MVWQRAKAAYLSSFSTELSLIQAAMMMPEATPRRLPDRSIASTGLMPLSSSISSGWPSTLHNHETEFRNSSKCHGTLNKMAKEAEG